MAVRETVDLDLERIGRLIEEEEGRLEPKHRASIEYKAVAGRTVAGGVARRSSSSRCRTAASGPAMVPQ